jgi:hypothetical protein
MASERNYCAERRRLFDEYVTAVSEYLLLESQVEASKRGEAYSSQNQVEAAWNRKEESKHAARKHRNEHGC